MASVPVPSPRPSADEAGRLRRTADSLLQVLDRLVPLASAVARGVRILAWSTLATAVVLVGAVLVFGDPAELTWAGLAVVLVLVVGSGVALLLFHGALVEVLALPGRLRQLPDVAATHADDLGRLVREARQREQRPRLGFVGDVFRAGHLLLRAHDDLPGYGSALRLVSWPFLIAAGLSVVFAPLLVALALALTASVVVF